MKIIVCIACLFAATHCFSQVNRKVSAYVSFNVNTTAYDRTQTNNATGFGAGLQLYVRTKTWVRPALDISSDIFGGTKELYLDVNDNPIYAKDAVTNLFAGAYFQLPGRLFGSFTAGPSFFNRQTHVGIKPGLGFYLLKGRLLAFKTSFTNVFQHDEQASQSFGYWNFSLSLKLF